MKKTMMKTAGAILFVVFVAIGCSKDDPESVSQTANFSPLTANSTWTYQNNNGSSYTLTATNRDTVANGKTYRVLSNSAGANIYLGKTGNNYYRFGAIAELGINAFEELYLKDNEPVNATWLITQAFSAPGIPVPLTANLNYTIKEKGISRSVSGKTYTNIVHVRSDLSITGFGSIGGGDFYYAEGIGLVESAVNVTVPGQAALNQSQVLTAYTIQ